MKKRALMSVSDKTGLLPLAKALEKLGFEMITTGGTAKFLEEKGLSVVKISELTEFPEILGGRVKTLHPKIFGGILARLETENDKKELASQGISPISLVCVNLYPFAQTIAKEGVSLEESIENIDIGGPSLIRAAAKNFHHVSVVVDPLDYDALLENLQHSESSLAFRFHLAQKAFAHTANYDAMIAQHLSSFEDFDQAKKGDKLKFPHFFQVSGSKAMDLRYGENPHQKAAFYLDPGRKSPFWRQIHGKELSFNNILDASASITLAGEFTQPACVIVKHTNPCGVARNDHSLLQAFEEALACDPLSAFGGIVAVNGEVKFDLAEKLSQVFLEVIIAPGFSKEALTLLSAKKNIRLLQMDSKGSGEPGASTVDVKRVLSGFLIQDLDQGNKNLLALRDEGQARVVTTRTPSATEWQSLEFSWSVARHVKSNAIVLSLQNRTIGIGAGQMSRVDASKLARLKAGEKSKGSVLASDAFFPFRDGIDEAAEAGVTAIVQPGGSVRDEEVIAAANEHSMTMVFTGRRHFKH